MNKITKLASILRKYSLYREASDVLSLQSAEHPDWKDEWEESKDYSPSEVVPNGLRSSYEDSAEKKMNDIMRGLGVTLLTNESGRPLGSGAHGDVYRCIYNGKPCVVKVQYYPAHEIREYGQDVARFNKLMGMWNSLPEFVRRHIPHVYLAKEGSFILKTYGYKLYQKEHILGATDIERFRNEDPNFPFKYQIVVMEELRKLSKRLEASIEGCGIFNDNEKVWLWEEELDNLYPKIWSELTRHDITPPSRGDISKIIKSAANNTSPNSIFDMPISSQIKELILDKIEEKFPSFNEERQSIYVKLSSIIDNFSFSLSSSIPRWPSEQVVDCYIPRDVEHFWNAVKWLRENGMEAGDIKPDNIMIDYSGVLKIADLGCL